MIGINHNLMALNVSRTLGNHYQDLSVSTQRLSSGLRISTAADDAAGLAVREMMRSDVTTLNQGIRNANDAISMIQTADGALQIIDEKLIRMKELAEQAATGTYTSDQRIIIDSEFQAMASEIQRIAVATDFNGIKLLDGHFDKSITSINQINTNGFGYGASNDISREVVEVNGKLYSGDREGHVWEYTGGTSWNMIYPGPGLSFVYNYDNTLIASHPSASGVKIMQYNNDGSWTQINSDGFGDSNNFGNDGCAIVNNKMFVSTHNGTNGTQVYGYNDDGTWTQVNDDGFGDSENNNCYLINYDNNLIATTWNPSGAKIYYNNGGEKWSEMSEDGFVDKYDTIRLASMNNKLYAIGSCSLGTRVYRYDNDSGWTPISESGLGDASNTDGFLTVFNNTLYASTGGTAVGSVAKFYKYDGNGQWTTINDNGLGDTTNNYCMLSATDDTLYATTYDTTDGCKIYTLETKNNELMEVQFGGSDTKNIDNYTINLKDAGISSRGLDLIDCSLKTQNNAESALLGINYAIKQKDKMRANLGATQNRLENTISNLEIQAENLQKAESQISDVDVADEMTSFVKEQILTQAATAMLSQANSMPKMALQLITGNQ